MSGKRHRRFPRRFGPGRKQEGAEAMACEPMALEEIRATCPTTSLAKIAVTKKRHLLTSDRGWRKPRCAVTAIPLGAERRAIRTWLRMT